MLEFGHQLQLR